VARYLAPYCRSLTCIDTDARMIEAAKERLRPYENVCARSADVHELPFRAASFDAVLLFHTLTYAAKPARALEECARVLRPGGRVVVLTLDAHDQQELTAPYGECHPGFTPRALKSLLVRAGLAVTSCEVACRETKKPHFQVVLSIARRGDRAKAASSKRTKAG
jgi:ArsR family transcriptional regulator